MLERYQLMQTSAGYRIYDFKKFDILKVRGRWYLEKERDKAVIKVGNLNVAEASLNS